MSGKWLKSALGTPKIQPIPKPRLIQNNALEVDSESRFWGIIGLDNKKTGGLAVEDIWNTFKTAPAEAWVGFVGVIFGSLLTTFGVWLMDSINSKYSKGTIKLASEGVNQGWAMRREFKSPNFASWQELPQVRA